MHLRRASSYQTPWANRSPSWEYVDARGPHIWGRAFGTSNRGGEMHALSSPLGVVPGHHKLARTAVFRVRPER